VYYHVLILQYFVLGCVQYVFLFFHCLIAICFTSFAVCYVVISCFFIIFYVYFLLHMFGFLFCIYCDFVLFTPMYLVVYILVVYNFTDHCHQVDTYLLLINIASYYYPPRKSQT
jgi:hypothetical protein